MGYIQESLFGKTYTEPIPATAERTSARCCKPFAKSQTPMPMCLDLRKENGGGAGCIVGDGYSVAWRTYDAQYWGVPQRRRRIFLVADFRGERAGEVLFEPESVRWDPAQGNPARETASVHAAGGDCGGDAVKSAAGFADGPGERAQGSMEYAESLSPTLRAGDARAVVYSVQGNTVDRDAKQNGNGLSESIAHTLNTTDRHAVIYDARGNGTGGWHRP